jgi:hypothetical protein
VKEREAKRVKRVEREAEHEKRNTRSEARSTPKSNLHSGPVFYFLGGQYLPINSSDILENSCQQSSTICGSNFTNYSDFSFLTPKITGIIPRILGEFLGAIWRKHAGFNCKCPKKRSFLGNSWTNPANNFCNKSRNSREFLGEIFGFTGKINS